MVEEVDWRSVRVAQGVEAAVGVDAGRPLREHHSNCPMMVHLKGAELIPLSYEELLEDDHPVVVPVQGPIGCQNEAVSCWVEGETWSQIGCCPP